MREPKIALVLSGGSALGFSHVGVIEELGKAGIKIDIVVGTSMGAVVGGAYAIGMTTQDMLKFAYKMHFLKFVDINFKPMGMFEGRKITDLLETIYGDKTHDDCICDFVAVSANIVDGQQVLLDSGKVLDSVRASMNIPGLLVPIEREGKLLIDGGVVNNYPDDIAKSMGADIIIGVDCLRNSYYNDKPKNAIMALFNSLQIIQNTMYKYKPSYTDVLITPNLKGMVQTDFKKESIDYAIEVGRQEAKKNIDKINKIINDWKKKNK